MIEERFLIDANSFVAPYQNFYPFDFAPGFWTQFEKALLKDSVSVLDVVKAEIDKGGDELTEWISVMPGLKIIDRRDQGIMTKYGAILSFLQNSPLYNDKALRAWSDVNVADPWLIAAAAVKGYTIITFEQSAGIISEKNPSGKPKIPDIARVFDVKCADLYYFMRIMNICWM